LQFQKVMVFLRVLLCWSFLLPALAEAKNNSPSKTNPPPRGSAKYQIPQVEGECKGLCAEWVAKTLLRAAYELQKVGEIGLAQKYFAELQSTYPNTKAARYARAVRPLDHSGRTSLIVFTTLYGAYVGGAFPQMFNVGNSTAIFGASILAFTGLGLVGSLFGTRHLNMNREHTALITTSTLWGVGNFFVLGLLLDFSFQNTFRAVTVGGILGYAAGFAISRYVPLKEGRTAFASSMGLWAAGYTGLAMGMLAINGVNVSGKAIAAALLAAADLGLVAGIFVHSKVRFSQSRTLLVNLSGAVGALGGASLLLIFGTSNATVPLATITLTSLAGLGLGIYLTRDMKKSSNADITASSGALFNYNGRQWAMGVPLPTITPDQRGGSEQRLNVSVPIAAGRW